jgi:hypothetical protein
MSVPSPVGGTLIQRVRAELRRAGFVVDPAALAVDGGLEVRHDAARGVVVSWVTAAELTVSDLAGRNAVRAAVHLALMAILTGAGYTVASDHATGAIIVTDSPDGDGDTLGEPAAAS